MFDSTKTNKELLLKNIIYGSPTISKEVVINVMLELKQINREFFEYYNKKTYVQISKISFETEEGVK